MTSKAYLALLAAGLTASLTAADWKQWGGPNRNFSVESGPLAAEWGPEGPRVVWSRSFGDGYSGILYEDGKLYSVYRDGDRDVVASLDADSGETVWETRYESPLAPDMILDFGGPPIVTPVLAGDRIFAVSSTARLRCLDKTTGQILWGRDLMEEMGAGHMGRGYGPNPIAYRDLIIVQPGAENQAVVAFRQADGEVVWRSQSFRNSYSAPILAQVDGEEQLLVAMGPHRAGLDPATGELRWQLELPPTAGSIMAMQHWGPDQLLFGSSAYADGSRAIEVRRESEEFEARELWYNRRMRVMFSSFVRIGDYVYGSSGDFGPAFLTAINVKTGEVAWRKRGFARTHFLHTGEWVVLLDEEGDLALATVSPEDLIVHARAHVIERTAWTPPTLVGTRLYIRNRSEIKAIELGLDQ